MLTTAPASPALGIEVRGADLTQPLEPEVKAELVRLFDEYGVLVLRDQAMTKANLIEATYIFGAPQVHPLGNVQDAEYPVVQVLSTHGTHGTVTPDPDEIVGKVGWHTDQAYVVNPNRGAMMYSAEIPPEGGMTGFIDMHKAYEALDEEMKARIDGLSVILSWRHAQETIRKNPSFRTDEGAKAADPNRFPDLVAPLVAPHPASGYKCLNVPPLWAEGIPELDEAEGRALLDELIEHACSPRFEYWHSYSPGDLVVWDNWRMLHAASGTKGQYRRTMVRTTIDGGPKMSIPLSEARPGEAVLA